MLLGTIENILINADNGIVEGFFVAQNSWFYKDTLFLSNREIAEFRRKEIYIPANVSLGAPEDHFRLQLVFSDKRKILGQKIITKDKIYLGRCYDVQINTDSWRMEWLFPKKWWFLTTPVPSSEIMEVTKSHILLKNIIKKASEQLPRKTVFPEMPEVSFPGNFEQ